MCRYYNFEDDTKKEFVATTAEMKDLEDFFEGSPNNLLPENYLVTTRYTLNDCQKLLPLKKLRK